MHISENGLNLIKKYEGLKLTAYKCPANVWTIGYGHTHEVYNGQTITENMATEFLKADVRHAERAIRKFVLVTLEQYQFNALVSFIYNVGSGAFMKSTLLRMLNKRDYEGAENQFKRWNKAGGRVLRGLSRRRADEAELFSGDYITVKAQDWEKSFVNDMPQAIDEPKIKTKLNSKTNITSIVGIGGVAISQIDTIEKTMGEITNLSAKGGDIADNVGGFLGAFDWKMMAVIGVIGLFGYIIHERNKKVNVHGL